MQCNHFNCALDSRVDSRTWILVRNMSTKTSAVLIANAAICLNPYYDDLSLLARKDLARVTYTSWHSKQATHLRWKSWLPLWENQLALEASAHLIPLSRMAVNMTSWAGVTAPTQSWRNSYLRPKVPSYRSNLLCLALGLFITSEPLAPKYVAHLRITPLSTLVLEASTNAPATE